MRRLGAVARDHRVGEIVIEVEMAGPLGFPDVAADERGQVPPSRLIYDLDDLHPEPPLLPAEALERAKVRAIAQMVACDIHPLNNLVTLQYLKRQLKHEQPEIDAWYHHWVIEGFNAIEAMIAPGPYACGAHVTLADVCLVPQVFNARRLKVPLDQFPKIVAAETACLKLPAFDKARPENQPDAE